MEKRPANGPNGPTTQTLENKKYARLWRWWKTSSIRFESKEKTFRKSLRQWIDGEASLINLKCQAKMWRIWIWKKRREKEKERRRKKNRKEILWKLRRQQLKVTLVYFWIAPGQRQSFEVESLAGGKKPWNFQDCN